MLALRGIPVVGGSRVGRAVLWEEASDAAVVAAPAPEDVEAEVRRLERGVLLAQQGLERLRESLGDASPVAGIFRFHEAMLEQLRPEVEAAIRAGAPAEHAVARVFHAHAARLQGAANAVVAQRSRDVVDLQRRLLRALAGLTGDEAGRAANALGPAVVVARDLTPSDTMALEGRNVAAIALGEGGATSHSSVIAKSLGIPLVVGVDGVLENVQPGDLVWVDGSRGDVVVEPDEATLARARGLGERYERLEATLLAESHLPAETLDGHRATLLANIEFPLDVEAGIVRGAEGVGLYRTEFLYDVRKEAGVPAEEDHLRAYRETLRRIGPRRLTVRTFDFGSDKERPGSGAREPNPALGVRSLRWCFANPEAFRVQLRALLRVAAEGDVRILFPMVGSLEELTRAKGMLRQVATELAEQGIAHRADVPVGIMVEIPGAALIADVLLPEVDFLSIGTNDLIQYDLAVDRLNPRVAPLFRPSHPSVLRLIALTLQAAERAGKPVTMCGEMGGHSIYAVLLLGMGLREFSLTPGYLPRLRRLLRGLTLVQARTLAAQCLRLRSADEVEAWLLERVQPVGAG